MTTRNWRVKKSRLRCVDPFLCTKNTSITTYVPSTLTISTFTTIGDSTWQAPAYVTNVEYLIVGGGGGGGAAYDTGSAGGGGGGLALYGTLSVIPGNTYNITVGDGGDGGIGDRTNSPYEYNGSDGLDSIFDAITANGGGGGYRSRIANGNAGLGGSAAVILTAPTGGNGAGSWNDGENGGGGGGNTTAGGSSNLTPLVSRTGGAGLTSNISGTSVTYGAGGTGGIVYTSSNGSSASNNTGNGGGGATSVVSDSKSGGKGGSGIVILKYYI